MAKDITASELADEIVETVQTRNIQTGQLVYQKDINKDMPTGYKNKKLFGQEFNDGEEEPVVIQERHYSESAWIDSRYYYEELKMLTIFFNPFTTNGKPEITLFNVEPSFVNAFDSANSKGKFYLKYIALYKWKSIGDREFKVPNKTAMFNQMSLRQLLFFEKGMNDKEGLVPNKMKKIVKNIADTQTKKWSNTKELTRTFYSSVIKKVSPEIVASKINILPSVIDTVSKRNNPLKGKILTESQATKEMFKGGLF